MSGPNNKLRPLLGVVAVILVVGALRETRAVTMPLGMGLFLAVLAWPLQRRLERKLPAGVSLAITFVVFLAVLSVFIGALVFCATAIAEKATDYQNDFIDLVGRAKVWLQHRGLPAEYLQLDPAGTMSHAISLMVGFATGLYSLVGQFIFVAVYFLLALLEMHWLQHRLGAEPKVLPKPEWLAAGQEIVVSAQRFMATRTVISVAMGVLTALYTWIIGLDFALVWGVSAFVLNYIPIFGAVVAVILPTLLALIQAQGAWFVLATFLGLATMHVVLGNYVDPWMQGKYLALPPLVLLFSITFWGWVWGVAGILMSVPLSAAVVIVCKHFERTRWIAELLAREPASADYGSGVPQ